MCSGETRLSWTPTILGVFGLGGALLFPHAAIALDEALGPFFGDVQSLGPDGSTLFPLIDQLKLDGQTKSGRRIRIGQFEHGRPDPEHVMLADRQVTRRADAGATDSQNSHATSVASVLVGKETWLDADNNVVPPQDPDFERVLAGVAPEAHLISAPWDDSSETGANSFFDGLLWLTGRGGGRQNVDVLNMSAGFEPGKGKPQHSRYVDYLVARDQVVWINAAGNDDTSPTIEFPARAANLITVGSTGNGSPVDYTQLADGSSEGRDIFPIKPDIVAPGQEMFMADAAPDGFDSKNGTSFAAPQVAATAALLLEWGRDGIGRQGAQRPDVQDVTDHRTLKATLLNSASKHVRQEHASARPWPELGVATNSSLPLDTGLGAGQLNGVAAARQYATFTDLPDSGQLEPLPVGVIRDQVASGGRQDYRLASGSISAEDPRMLLKGALVTSTLVWDRPVTLSPGADPNVPESYGGLEIPNLTLQLIRDSDGRVVHQSNSGPRRGTGGSNVEHLYVNTEDEDSYFLRVINHSTEDVPFALAWSSGSIDGHSFSVDRFARGSAQAFDGIGQVNDVSALGDYGASHFPISSEIFSGNAHDGQNMQRLSGALGTKSTMGPHHAPPAAIEVIRPRTAFRGIPSDADKPLIGQRSRGLFGLRPFDNLNGLSWGTDGSLLLPAKIYFSVDPLLTDGLGGTDVAREAGQDEAAGDIFNTRTFRPWGGYLSFYGGRLPPNLNRQFVDEDKLGLYAAPGQTAGEDDLDALELDSPSAVDTKGEGSHERTVFFTLDTASPTILQPHKRADQPVMISPDDIFFSTAPGQFRIFADGHDHLKFPTNQGTLALDALAVSDVTPPKDGNNPDRRESTLAFIAKPNDERNPQDEVMFSFRSGFAPNGADPASLYATNFDPGRTSFDPARPYPDPRGNLYEPAARLGLSGTDELNALDVGAGLGRLGFPVVSRHFQLNPDATTIIHRHIDILDFAITNRMGEATGSMTLSVSESIGFGGGGEPQELAVIVEGFDSGDVAFQPGDPDAPGRHGFFEWIFVPNTEFATLPVDSFLAYHFEIRDEQGNLLPLVADGEGQFVNVDFEAGDGFMNASFVVDRPGIGLEQYNLLTQVPASQEIEFTFADLSPAALVASGNAAAGMSGAASGFDLLFGVARSGHVDLNTPLFSTQITSIARVPEPPSVVLFVWGLFCAVRHRRLETTRVLAEFKSMRRYK